MNSETSESLNTMNGPGAGSETGLNGAVHRVAQKAHETVDKLEQTIIAPCMTRLDSR